MRRQFVGSLFLLLLLNFIIKPVWIFGIDLTVQNRVGASEYGIYTAIFSFSLILNIILDLGLSHFNNRAVARDSAQVSRNFSQFASLKILLSAAYLFITLFIGFFLGYSRQFFLLFFLLLINQILVSFILFIRSNLAGLHFFKKDAIMSVFDKVMVIILCGFLLFGNGLETEFTVAWFAGAQCVSSALAILLGVFFIKKNVPVLHIEFSFQKIAKNLKESLPYALLLLLMALYTRVDSIMIQQISGSFETGIYAQAFRLLDISNQGGYLMSVLLLPIFAGLLARHESVKPLAQLAFSMVWVATLALSAAVYFAAGDLMEFLYADHAELSKPIIKLLIISTIAFGTTFIFGTLLTAAGRLKTLNRVAVGGFLLNIVVNYLLIPKFGAEGAAVATVATQFLTALVQAVIAFSALDFSFENAFWYRLVGFSATVFLMGFLLNQPAWDWPVQMLSTFGIALALSLPFGLFDWKAAIQLLRSRLG